MNPSKYAFQAGLFILLSIAAGIFLIARVAESRGTPSDAIQYTAIFPAGKDIAGLDPGAEVRLLGVKVGRVEGIEVVTPQTADQDAEVRVHFIVGGGVRLRQNEPKVDLQTALTGGAWLNILSVGTGEHLAEGGKVTGNTTDLFAMVGEVRREMALTLAALREDLDEVSTELVETAESIETTAGDATKLIAKIDKQVDPLLQDVDTFLEESTAVMTDIRGVFGDSGEDIRITLAKLSSLTTTLDVKLPKSVDQITAFIEKAETSIEDVDKLVTEITGAATEVRALLADNRPDIDRTIESARRSVDGLEGLVDDLRANPSRLLWPPDDKDLNNQDLYATARSYAKAAEDLESAAAALHQASTDEGADDAKLQALREQLMQQFQYFDKLQAEVWERYEK